MPTDAPATPGGPPPEPSLRAAPLELLRQREATRLIAAGALVGLVAGLAAAALDRAIVVTSMLTLGSAEPSTTAPHFPWIVLGPVVGAILASELTRRLTSRSRPQGVPDVLASLRSPSLRLGFRDGVLSAVGAVIAVGGGLSGGREGPIVQLSSTLAAKVCQLLQVRRDHARVLVAAGAAAGIAASFNTPLGGAFFALEIIVGNFAVETFAPVVAATVVGTIVGQAVLGERIALVLPAFRLEHVGELGLYAVLGVLCALVGFAFRTSVARGGQVVGSLSYPPWARAGLVGLVVGVAGLLGASPVMGNGYAWMQDLLTGQRFPVLMLAFVLVAKVVATGLTAGVRTGAGVFAPTLFVGAATGALFGVAAKAIWPEVATPGAYGMVGMGALTAAVLHAPITMSLMLFEMTGNYLIILPLMLSIGVAGLFSRLLQSKSLYEAELAHLGPIAQPSREELVMYDLRVRDVMRVRGGLTTHADTPERDVLDLFLRRRHDEVHVIEPDGRYVGTIDIQHVKTRLASPGPQVTARELAQHELRPVGPDEPLAEVLTHFFATGAEELPVLDREGRLVATLAERDVVAAYHREVLRQDARLTRVQSGPADDRRTDFLELPPGYLLEVLDAGAGLAGRTLRELRLPERIGCSVVAMSVWSDETGEYRRAAPDSEHVLRPEDRLVVVGPVEGIRRLRAEAVRPDHAAPDAGRGPEG